MRVHPQNIKLRYASASFVDSNRVVFNIKGNEFRLIIAVAYRFAAVYIRFVGTHKLCPTGAVPMQRPTATSTDL